MEFIILMSLILTSGLMSACCKDKAVDIRPQPTPIPAKVSVLQRRDTVVYSPSPEVVRRSTEQSDLYRATIIVDDYKNSHPHTVATLGRSIPNEHELNKVLFARHFRSQSRAIPVSVKEALASKAGIPIEIND